MALLLQHLGHPKLPIAIHQEPHYFSKKTTFFFPLVKPFVSPTDSSANVAMIKLGSLRPNEKTGSVACRLSNCWIVCSWFFWPFHQALRRIEPLIVQPDKFSYKSVGSCQAFNLNLSGVGPSHSFVDVWGKFQLTIEPNPQPSCGFFIEHNFFIAHFDIGFS